MWKALVVLVVAIGFVVGGFIASQKTAFYYTPTTTLLLTDSAPDAPSFDVVTPPPVSAATYRTYILDGDVLSRVLEDRGEPINSTEIEELRRALDVKIEEQQVSSIIRVSLTDADPERAADIVNRIAHYTVTWDAERGRRSLEAGVDSLEAALDGLRERRAAEAAAGADTDTTDALIERQEQELDSARERLAELIVVPLLDVLRVVEPPTEPDPKHELRNAVIGGVAAGAVVYLIMLPFTRRRRKAAPVKQGRRPTGRR